MVEVGVYEPELLRTFLAVSQSLSFTQAGASLGIAQPTVSQHVRKLENAVGRSLFVRDTHSVTLTADGDAMAGFARSILAAQEEAVSYFTGSGLSGRLRLGVTDDLALTPVPRILHDFRQLYPRIDLELTVSQSGMLQRRVEFGHLDIAFIKQTPGQERGQLVRRDRLVWAGVDGSRLQPDQPVPLIVYQAPSITRSLGVKALEQASRPYRVRCTVRGVLGAVAAARAGLGLAIFARSLVPDDLSEFPADTGLPDLGEIDSSSSPNNTTPPAQPKRSPPPYSPADARSGRQPPATPDKPRHTDQPDTRSLRRVGAGMERHRRSRR